MGKRVQKKTVDSKVRRTRSMDECLQDAKEFLRSRKITKTKTMLRTIAEAKTTIVPKKTALKSRPKAAPRRVAPLPVRPARKSLPAVAPAPALSLPPMLAPVSAPIRKTTFKPSRSDLPLPAFGFIDVCFCVDATGSMSGELAQVKSTIETLIEHFSNKVRTEGITLRFAIVSYRDHGDKDMIQIKDFTDPYDAVNFSKTLYAGGGGDEPEAAHDGILAACKNLSWMDVPHTPMLRYIFHVLDAPPHGKEFGTGEAKEGCTCGISTDTILNEMNMRQIHYRMIKVRANPRVDIAENLFKRRLGNFDSVDIMHAPEMDIRVSDMVIMEVMPQA